VDTCLVVFGMGVSTFDVQLWTLIQQPHSFLLMMWILLHFFGFHSSDWLIHIIIIFIPFGFTVETIAIVAFGT
jgi:hypothetical protein